MADVPSPSIRLAGSDDFPEILRLALLLWDDMGFAGINKDSAWTQSAQDFFSDGVAAGTTRAFVASDPGDPQHLIACGIGVIMRQMPAHWLPNGKMGYLQWFSTEATWRKLGLATDILEALMKWFNESDVMRVQLHGSEAGLSIYRRAGFEDTAYPNLWFREIR
jgi:GNAT superfamily N-acetyltransferase